MPCVRGTYEVPGWAPSGAGVQGWAGCRVWLVPDDNTLSRTPVSVESGC